jgi:hypothetical protein
MYYDGIWAGQDADVWVGVFVRTFRFLIPSYRAQKHVWALFTSFWTERVGYGGYEDAFLDGWLWFDGFNNTP